jgi:hypothetical protein
LLSLIGSCCAQQASRRSQQEGKNANPAQEGNYFPLGSETEVHVMSMAFNPRDPAEYLRFGAQAVSLDGIVSLGKERIAPVPDNPVDNQTITRRGGEGCDIAWTKICRGTGRNGDDVSMSDKRSHTATVGKEPDRRAFCEHLPQESRQFRCGETEFNAIPTVVHDFCRADLFFRDVCNGLVPI